MPKLHVCYQIAILNEVKALSLSGHILGRTNSNQVPGSFLLFVINFSVCLSGGYLLAGLS